MHICNVSDIIICGGPRIICFTIMFGYENLHIIIIHLKYENGYIIKYLQFHQSMNPKVWIGFKFQWLWKFPKYMKIYYKGPSVSFHFEGVDFKLWDFEVCA